MLPLWSNKSKSYNEEYIYYTAFSCSAKGISGIMLLWPQFLKTQLGFRSCLYALHAANLHIFLLFLCLRHAFILHSACTFLLQTYLVNYLRRLGGFLPPLLGRTICCMTGTWLVRTRSKTQCLVDIAVQRFERQKINLYMRFTSWDWDGHL